MRARGTDDARNRWFGWASVTRIMAVAAAFLLVGALVVTASRATFTATTSNSANTFAAGDVTLSDDDSATALFDVANMEPGDSTTDCIVATYQGSIDDPSPVRLYSGGYTDSGDFADYLNLTIAEGSGGSFGDCTGFVAGATIETGGTVADFDSTHTDYASGAGTWDPAGTPESTTYRVTVELDPTTPNSEEGESVTALTFTWEVSS